MIERERLACGPSGSSAGGLTPGIHTIARPPAFAGFAAASLALHRALDEEWDGAFRMETLDWLIVSAERIALDAIDVPGIEVLDADAARAAEPKLGEVGGAISIREQSWVQPQRLAIELARRAGSVATGVVMTGSERRGDRVRVVRTSAGDISPGAIVLATGAAPPGIDIPQSWTKGHLLVTAPAPDPPRAAVASSIIVLPLADGRLLAGGTFDHGDDEPVVRDHVVAQIVEEMARILPSTEGIAVERAWCCFRPGTPDEMPVIDRLPGTANAWLNVAHYRTGLLLAPASGRAVADLIGGGEPPGVAAFGLGRFT